MTEAATGEKLAQEIRALVEQELRSRGERATIRLDGQCLTVGRGAAAPRADIAGTVAQWAELPDDLRAKRITQIAQLLTPGTLASPSVPRTKARPGAGWSSIFAPLLVVVATAGVLLVAYRYLAPNGAALTQLADGTPSTASANHAALPDPDRERTALAGTACEQARARVARGANIGPADVEGWVVELVLLRREGGAALASSPTLARYIKKKTDGRSSASVVTWPGAHSLEQAKRFDAEVAVSPVLPLGSQRLAGVRLEFSGPYVVPYFSEEQRTDYVLLADELSDALQISDGALFARCAGGTGHHIGSWFLGRTPGAAVASLVYFMAFFNETPVLKSELYGSANTSSDAGGAFDRIGSAAADLDRSAAATLVGAELGMISGRPERPTRLTFPFRDANRATRASLTAARALRLANQ